MSSVSSTKRCSKCGKDRPLTDFHRRSHHVKSGLRAACKACTAADTKARRTAREMTPEAKLKARVRQRTRQAILRGELVPESCRDCGALEVQAHHPEYESEHAHLQVVWLCVEHHHLEHGQSAWARQIDLFPAKTRSSTVDPRLVHRVSEGEGQGDDR